MANPENKQIPYESTQKDIRDAIESVATAIGGITHPDAEDIVYDNSVSGLSATDVQNAIDELSSEKADSSSLATVATSGDYDDLINKPAIPTVNDGTLTIQKNGTTIDTFTANSATNKTVNVTVPTATSDLNNDSDFVSDASYVHTDNNFTSALLTKLNGIESGAEVNVQSDWNEADNTADDYIKNKPSSEVKSATDTFTTVNGGLLSKCVIDLVPVQSGSGDPSPDNIRPISGHTEVDLYNVGKNLADFVKGKGIASDGTIIDFSSRSATVNPIKIISGKSYRYYSSTSKACIYSVFNDGTLVRRVASIASGSILDTSDGTDLYVCGYGGDDTSPVADGLMVLYSDETDYTFEPYLGHLYQVQIGSTVYGGTVDLVSGVFVSNKAMIDLSTISSWSDASGGRKTSNAIQNVVKAPESTEVNCECDSYKPCSSSDLANDPTLIGIGINSGKLIVVRTADGNAPSSGMLCYELATPQTIQLTPQQIEALVGQNNLSTPLDGQSIQTNGVEYREVFAFDDVEKVVSLRVPISMLGTDESGRTTASQSYASGDYFYKDGYMCKALTSISAGATLTLNTNYSQGTLADVLKAIENA